MNESVNEGWKKKSQWVKEKRGRWNANKERAAGRENERMDELMDYKWLVPNVSGVFALLPHHWKNLLNQSEVLAYKVDPRSWSV